jgi:PAS domain S-box-containing protein
MTSFREIPRGARALILAVAVAGAGAILWRAPDVARWTAFDAAAWIALSLACAALEQFTVSIAHESETENYSLTDALWIPALIFARPSVLTFAVAAGVLLGHSARRWAWYKVAYNVAQFVLAITAAEIVFGLFGLPASLSVMHWVATALAMLVYFSLNELFIAAVLSLVEGEPLRRLLVLPEGLNLLQAAGNLTIGLLAALVWSTGPVGIPLLVAPMVLSYLAYRGWLHSKQEEQQAKERERMQTLYEAGRALFGPLDESYDFLRFLQLVRRMVDAAGVELVTVDDDIHVYNSETGPSLTQPIGGDGVAPERFVSTRPGLFAYLATIGGGADRSGVLAVHRAHELSAAEASLVDALASQIQVRRENERLFHETAEQRGQLADVIGNTSDGIFVASPEREILSWNPAMERITGYPRDDAVGRSCDDVLRSHDDDAADAAPLALAPGETHDALIARSDGSKRWIRYTTSAMPGRTGGPKAVVVVARDVTAELEAEELKSDFVATVSHELRSPLTPLKGFIASLRDGLVNDAPEARAEYYDIMWRQVERLERLINDLLEVSRIEAGKLEIDVAAIDLSAVLGNHVAESAASTADREIRYDAPADTVWALADPFRFEQIVSNLLSNAAKYSPPRTPIVVALGSSDDVATVAVRNEGDGIPVEDQGRVFDRFFRVQSGEEHRGGGFGLGLFICKRLVEAMGGTIGLVSQPGEGCTFSFTLPLADRATGSDGSASIGERNAADARAVSRPA